jgi:hypothetical protein
LIDCAIGGIAKAQGSAQQPIQGCAQVYLLMA